MIQTKQSQQPRQLQQLRQTSQMTSIHPKNKQIKITSTLTRHLVYCRDGACPVRASTSCPIRAYPRYNTLFPPHHKTSLPPRHKTLHIRRGETNRPPGVILSAFVSS